MGTLRDVVDADDGEVLRDPSSQRVGRVEYAERHLVIAREDGVDAGALVVYFDSAHIGREVWLSRRGQLARIHVEILQRTTRAGQVYAAVFPSLREGDYEIWFGGTKPAAEVTIVAGEVREMRLMPLG